MMINVRIAWTKMAKYKGPGIIAPGSSMLANHLVKGFVTRIRITIVAIEGITFPQGLFLLSSLFFEMF